MSINSTGGLGRDPGAQHTSASIGHNGGPSLDLDDIDSVPGVCRYLRCSRATVYRLIALGQLRRVKILGKPLIYGSRGLVARQLAS